MGRPTIKKNAMTPAERQRRRRHRLKKEEARAASVSKGAKAKDKAKALYVPVPPGVNYWQEVVVQTAEGERVIWTPTARPLASVDGSELSDADVLELLQKLEGIAAKRGLARAS